MSGWTIAWLIWGAAFLAIELPAAFNRRPGDTLSETVWRWFRVKDPRPTAVTWTLRVALAAFLVWLTVHLTFGVWPS